jgi:hypothetical protein
MIKPTMLEDFEIHEYHSVGLMQIGPIYAVFEWQIDGSRYVYFSEDELDKARNLLEKIVNHEKAWYAIYLEENSEINAIPENLDEAESKQSLLKIHKKYRDKSLKLERPDIPEWWG